MDSLQTFVSAALGPWPWWAILKELLTAIAALGGPFIAWFALRQTKEMRATDLLHNEKLKQLELQEAERNRKFTLQHKITERSLEVVAHSYYLTHQMNRWMAECNAEASESAKKDFFDHLSQARFYWEENLFYLPEQIRKHVYPLTNAAPAILRDGNLYSYVQAKAWDEIHGMFQDIEAALSTFMKDYNLFDSAGAIENEG